MTTTGLAPELVVVAHPDARLRMNGARVLSSADGAAELDKALAETGARLRPMFGPSEEHVLAARRASPWALPDLSVFYHAAAEGDHHAVAARLAEVPALAGAYVKPPPVIDARTTAGPTVAETAAATVTPDLTPHQGYLLAAPGGVGAGGVRSQPGGDGAGAQVVIVGGAWRFSHEDLAASAGVVVGGQPIDAVSFRNHGTAMLGIVRATANGFGMTGIAPGCQVRQVATFGLGTAAAIRLAADSLQQAGGIILIEWQRPGPEVTGAGSAGFLPLEWWPDDFAAISYATGKHMIVIEPAGNGAVSLDDPVYNTPAPGFPATWRNPFNRASADCGSILVGAGAPPSGQDGAAPPDRSRLPFSNTGACVDAQGWGSGIATLGYGDLQGGASEDTWYTAAFGGTSGAAAMVAGVVATLQSVQLGGAKRPPLTPADVRGLLRQSGSAQADGPDGPAQDHPIGSRPDLVALAARLVPPKDESKDNKDGKDEHKEKVEKEAKEKSEVEAKADKDIQDKPHLDDRVVVLPDPGTPTARRSTARVRHFISGELRPELTAAALLHEPGLRGRDPAELAAELRPGAA